MYKRQVLDGGRGAWLAAGGTLSTSEPAIGAGPAYPASAAPGMPDITARELFARLSSVQDGSLKLLDARAAERFRGEVEPLDPVAGHIPGATLRFFKDNLAADGRFKPVDQLRRDFEALGARGANSIQPVSYTHLDVYKRQVQFGQRHFIAGRFFGGGIRLARHQWESSTTWDSSQ